MLLQHQMLLNVTRCCIYTTKRKEMQYLSDIKNVIEIANVANSQTENFYLGEFLVRRKCWK